MTCLLENRAVCLAFAMKSLSSLIVGSAQNRVKTFPPAAATGKSSPSTIAYSFGSQNQVGSFWAGDFKPSGKLYW
jgi:hypothetical protein